ncbi:MAG TPA: helix-turn-helix transcriptional regulator [Actinomycetota bacterium]|nr:helix-turn-helix transcriptional regulator [Actinomycetota bacterium]
MSLEGPRDRETAMNPTQIVTEALLVVSILDGSMGHASVRRCLQAALAALDEAPEKGTLLLNGRRRIEFASETPERILKNDLEMPVAQLPERIAEWHASACGTLVIAGDGSTLVIEATGAGSAPLPSERPSGDDMLTARERDVMRCIEDGLSNAEIARELWIQPTTVRKHLENIFAKLGVRSRTAALSKLLVSRARAS